MPNRRAQPLLGALLMLGLSSCSDPKSASIEPGMREAITAVATAAKSTELPTRSLSPICGPTDERLGGALLELRVHTPAPTDLQLFTQRASAALAAQELEVSHGEAGSTLLLTASPTSGEWSLQVARPEPARLEIRATGKVGDEPSPSDLTPLCG